MTEADSAYRQAQEQHDGQLLKDVFAREDRAMRARLPLDTLTVRHLLKMADDVEWAARDCPPDSPLVVLVEPTHLRLLCEAWLQGIRPVVAAEQGGEQEVNRAQIMLPLDLRAPPE